MPFQVKEQKMCNETRSEFEARIFQDEYIKDAWDGFIHEGDPLYLAEYLDRGGEINDEVKNAIVRVLRSRTRAEKLRGENSWRDVAVYNAIENMLKLDAIARKLHEQSVVKSDSQSEMTLGKAISTYISQHHFNEEISKQRIRAQYKRGKRRVEERNKKV